MLTSLIEIRSTAAKGRGVFARSYIAADTLLDEAPVLVLPGGALEGTPLDEYRFEWEDGDEAVAFGAVSLANHGRDPNAWVEMDPEGGVMRLLSKRPIRPGEEITVDYGCDLWFEPAG